MAITVGSGISLGAGIIVGANRVLPSKAIFGYGTGNLGLLSITNLVSNTGVVAEDTTGVGTARRGLAAGRYR